MRSNPTSFKDIHTVRLSKNLCCDSKCVPHLCIGAYVEIACFRSLAAIVARLARTMLVD